MTSRYRLKPEAFNVSIKNSDIWMDDSLNENRQIAVVRSEYAEDYYGPSGYVVVEKPAH
jgi:hypothetical protein